VNKKFSRTLYNNNDAVAKQEAIILLSQLGYSCVNREEAFKNGDLVFEKPIEVGVVEIRVEVERRGEQSWNSGIFKFDTVHIPNRKNGIPVDCFISFSHDMNYALFISSNFVYKSSKVKVNTFNMVSNECTQSEDFLNVTIDENITLLQKIDGTWRKHKEGWWLNGQ
jgi:hypothetical protein